jgi:exopolysaccharide biosynthesis WecB/TagA/CpsF family protein
MRQRTEIAGMPIDLVTCKELDEALQHREAELPFEYITTPNVDHVVKNHRHGLRFLYENAWFSVCDSRIILQLAKFVRIHIPEVITGSDLTTRILENYLKSGDHVTVIGVDGIHIQKLKKCLPQIHIHHYNPPMGFIGDKAETDKAVQFIVEHPSRFVFFAVGAPQQEKLAFRVREKKATGIGLCVGASILFFLGVEKRAPLWLQKCSLEWLFRLTHAPSRLWRRYLFDDPKIFWLILKQRLHMKAKNIQQKH